MIYEIGNDKEVNRGKLGTIYPTPVISPNTLDIIPHV